MVSDKHALKRLIQQLGSSLVANSAYQSGPTWGTVFTPQFINVIVGLTHFKFENWSNA